MFLECQAILAAQDGDDDELDRIYAELQPGERAELARAADRLADRMRRAAT